MSVIAKSTLLPQFIQEASLMYRNKSYIANMVAPVLDVKSSRAKITKYNKGDFFRNEAKVRAPGAEPNVIGFKTSSESINTIQYDAAYEITKEDLQNEGIVGGAPTTNMKQDSSFLAVDKLDILVEKAVADVIRASVWSSVAAGGTDAEGLWAPTGSTNTFVADINLGKNTILSNTGMEPNILVIDYNTWLYLKEVDEINDKMKTTDDKTLLPQRLASLLELDYIVVGKAVYSSAVEKQDGTDFTAVKIWDGPNATKGMGFLAYVAPRPALKTPSALYRPRTHVLDSGNYRAVYEHVVPTSHKTIIQAVEDFQVLACGLDLGYMWKDTISD